MYSSESPRETEYSPDGLTDTCSSDGIGFLSFLHF